MIFARNDVNAVYEYMCQQQQQIFEPASLLSWLINHRLEPKTIPFEISKEEYSRNRNHFQVGKHEQIPSAPNGTLKDAVLISIDPHPTADNKVVLSYVYNTGSEAKFIKYRLEGLDTHVLREFMECLRSDEQQRFSLTIRESPTVRRSNVVIEIVEPEDKSGKTRNITSTTAKKRPPRHGRKQGTLGIPNNTGHRSPAELNQRHQVPSKAPEEWSRRRDRIVHVLSFYEWENGLLTRNRGLEELIAPIPKTHDQSAITLCLPQLSFDAHTLAIVRDIHNNNEFIRSSVLEDFFHDYLLAGAKIELAVGKKDNEYVLRYIEADLRSITVLVYDKVSGHFVFQARGIQFEVDDGTVIAESRFSNLTGLKRIDVMDPRMAERVLWDVFERVGEIDEAGRWIAEEGRLIAAAMLQKPFSEGYLRQILSGDRRWPFFYEHNNRKGWYVRDDALIGYSHPPIPVLETPKSKSATAPTGVEIDEGVAKTSNAAEISFRKSEIPALKVDSETATDNFQALMPKLLLAGFVILSVALAIWFTLVRFVLRYPCS